MPQGSSNPNTSKSNSFARGSFENNHHDSEESSNNLAPGDDREWMMEKVRLFNATHQGRFGAAERERVLQKQADDVKESVQ